jgi:hypothetical protein
MALASRVVSIPHPELGDDVEQVLGRIGGVDVGCARIRSHSQERKAARLPEFGIERELVIHFRDAVHVRARTGEIDVIAAGLEAGAHHIHVRSRKSRIQDNGNAAAADSSSHIGAVAGIQMDGRNAWILEPIRKEGSAGGHRVGDDEFLEHRLLHEFEGGHGPHRAGS